MVPCMKNSGALSVRPEVPSPTDVTGTRIGSGHGMPGNECPLVAPVHSVGTSSLSYVHFTWGRAFLAPE
eukprot:8825880-Pyramimonas_sp.AAC.1